MLKDYVLKGVNAALAFFKVAAPFQALRNRPVGVQNAPLSRAELNEMKGPLSSKWQAQDQARKEKLYSSTGPASRAHPTPSASQGHMEPPGLWHATQDMPPLGHPLPPSMGMERPASLARPGMHAGAPMQGPMHGPPSAMPPQGTSYEPHVPDTMPAAAHSPAASPAVESAPAPRRGISRFLLPAAIGAGAMYGGSRLLHDDSEDDRRRH